MNLTQMVYICKNFYRALISGMQFDRIRQAQNISMDLDSSPINNQVQRMNDVNDTAIDLLDGHRVVTGTDGRLIHIKHRE